MTVAVEVAWNNARAVLENIRKGIPRADEISVSVVDVEPVAERFRVPPEFVAAAHHIKVGIPVAIGIEEHRIHVFVQTVRTKHWFTAAPEPAVTSLDEQLSSLPLCAASVHIIQPIAVHIADCESGPLGREQVRHEGFAIEIEERVLRD